MIMTHFILKLVSVILELLLFSHRIYLQTPCSTSLVYCQWQAVLSLVKIFGE